MMHQPIKYRSDIDGLRALAILPVVFYHAEWWPFTGGYVGVDIFFVISGYLITTILIREMKDDIFSFVGFYERRARRILPAIFSVLFFCCIVSYFLLMPRGYKEFAENLIGTIFFISNFSIWQHSSGYFEADSNVKLLLHTWSLSVEEQFYLLFPPVLLFLVWISRKIKTNKILPLFIYATFFVSLAASVAVAITEIGIRTSFFFLPFRAWELMLGALLALDLLPTLHNRRVCDVLALLGLLFIGVAVVSYDHSIVYPGYAALLPCLGAALLIHTGRQHVTWIGHLLGSKAFVFIGLISYSLYLWHWPLLVFARLLVLDELSWKVSLFTVCLSVVLAGLSWRYIERPFRGKGGWLNRQQLFALALLISVAFVAFGGAILWSGGWKSRLPEQALKVLDIWNEIALWHEGVIGPIEDRRFVYELKGCSPADVNYDKGRYIIVGDSYAKMLEPLLNELAEKYRTSIKSLTRVGVDFRYIPMIGMSLKDSQCDTEIISRSIANSTEINTVIISASYQGKLSSSQPWIDRDQGKLYGYYDRPDRIKLFSSNLQRDIKGMIKAGKRVVIIYPFPGYTNDIPTVQARYLLSGQAIEDFKIPESYFWDQNSDVISAMDGLGESEHIIRIKPHEILCDGQWCKTATGEKPLYLDGGHLSQAGVNLLRPQLEAIFKDPKWN